MPEVTNSLPLLGAPLEDGAGQGPVPRGGCGQKVAQSRAVVGPWGRLSSRSSCALGLLTHWPCSTQATRGRSPGTSREGPEHGQ